MVTFEALENQLAYSIDFNLFIFFANCIFIIFIDVIL